MNAAKVAVAMQHPGLPHSSRVLFWVLARRADHNGFVYDTLPEIAKVVHVAPCRLPAIAAPLEELGFIRREPAKGHGKGRKRYVMLALAAALLAGTALPTEAHASFGQQSNFPDMNERDDEEAQTEKSAAAA